VVGVGVGSWIDFNSNPVRPYCTVCPGTVPYGRWGLEGVQLETWTGDWVALAARLGPAPLAALAASPR
jgi:hypothetical protein